MNTTLNDYQIISPNTKNNNHVLYARLLIGFFQGIVLWLFSKELNHVFNATGINFSLPLLLLILFIPFISISGITYLSKKQFIFSLLITTTLLAMLGFYDAWSNGFLGTYQSFSRQLEQSYQLLFFSIIFIYITQSLNLASAFDKKAIATYQTYFEIAWKLIIQIKFSILFILALWLVLQLGAILFSLVEIYFLKNLISKGWFSISITTLAFSFAFHITDVHPKIVRGIRTLLLVLMSWLLPIITILVFGFLICLPFTGLKLLWGTKSATAILLSASAVLIILINTAYQDGRINTHITLFLKYTTRLAAVLLLPLTALGVYALGLRVHEYGWTIDRVIAGVCLLISTCYCIGYAFAAINNNAWMKTLPRTNITTALVVVTLFIAIFSPIADPARISVASQLHRLQSGAVKIDRFDFAYLKFNGKRYGLDALEMLKKSGHGKDTDLIHRNVELALNKESKWDSGIIITNKNMSNFITMWPSTDKLPGTFIEQNWNDGGRSQFQRCDKKCEGYLIDFNDDGNKEVMIVDEAEATIFALAKNKQWIEMGNVNFQTFFSNSSFRKKMMEGEYSISTPKIRDLEIDGRRIHLFIDTDYDRQLYEVTPSPNP